MKIREDELREFTERWKNHRKDDVKLFWEDFIEACFKNSHLG